MYKYQKHARSSIIIFLLIVFSENVYWFSIFLPRTVVSNYFYKCTCTWTWFHAMTNHPCESAGLSTLLHDWSPQLHYLWKDLDAKISSMEKIRLETSSHAICQMRRSINIVEIHFLCFFSNFRTFFPKHLIGPRSRPELSMIFTMIQKMYTCSLEKVEYYFFMVCVVFAWPVVVCRAQLECISSDSAHFCVCFKGGVSLELWKSTVCYRLCQINKLGQSIHSRCSTPLLEVFSPNANPQNRTRYRMDNSIFTHGISVITCFSHISLERDNYYGLQTCTFKSQTNWYSNRLKRSRWRRLEAELKSSWSNTLNARYNWAQLKPNLHPWLVLHVAAQSSHCDLHATFRFNLTEEVHRNKMKDNVSENEVSKSTLPRDSPELILICWVRLDTETHCKDRQHREKKKDKRRLTGQSCQLVCWLSSSPHVRLRPHTYTVLVLCLTCTGHAGARALCTGQFVHNLLCTADDLQSVPKK